MCKRFSLLLLMMSLLTAGVLLAGNAAPYDPWVGTWTLDLQRSKFAAGFPKPASQTIVVEFSGEAAVKFSSDTVEADGKKTHIEFVTAYDGKPTTLKGSPLADTVAVTQPRPHYRTYIYSKGGNVVSSNDVVLWGNAQLMTINSKEVRGSETVENVQYYRKKLQP